MKKRIKKLFATTLVATTLLGCSISTCAYDLPKPKTPYPSNAIINNISLIATPVATEVSKYPQIDIDDYSLISTQWDNNMFANQGRDRLTLNYTDIQGNIYSSGNILLGVDMGLNCNLYNQEKMACIRLNGIDLQNTYAATYTVDVKKYGNRKDLYEYNAIVRLEPSYSVFGNDVDIKVYHTYDCELDRFEIMGEFKVSDTLLMDGFEVVLDAAPNASRPQNIRTPIRSSKFVGEANVLTYSGANPLSDEDITTEGRILFAYSDEPISKSRLNYEFDVYFNGIKVADNITIADPINR